MNLSLRLGPGGMKRLAVGLWSPWGDLAFCALLSLLLGATVAG